MGKAGPILGLIGGLLMMIAGILSLNSLNLLSAVLQTYGMTFESLGLDMAMINLNFTLTFVWGIIALIGAIVGFKKVKVGGAILLVVGIIAIAGLFIQLVPAKVLTLGPEVAIIFPAIRMNSAFIWVDPFLIALGGIIALMSSSDANNKEVDYHKRYGV